MLQLAGEIQEGNHFFFNSLSAYLYQQKTTTARKTNKQTKLEKAFYSDDADELIPDSFANKYRSPTVQ